MVNAGFLAGAGLLAVLATGITLWPLWRAGKRRIWGSLVALALVATLGLYQWLGTPAALQPHAEAAAAPQTIEEGISQLQAALQQNPERVDGWVLLARSQLEIGKVADAAASYQRAAQLAPDEPTLLIEAAQTRAQADPKLLFDATAQQWLAHARQIAPDNERAIWLTGIVQRQQGQNEQAAQTWESLLSRLEPAAASALQEQIDIARGKTPSTAHGANAASTPASGAGNSLTVTVSLAPALAARAASGKDTVFVIARIPGGPPMPVAVERHPAQSEPLTVTLDDADSPMPTQKLSALQEVEVFARLSASGTAMRGEGDVESAPIKIKLPADKPLTITLGQ
ncbi:cytochrome C biogenesis protein [Stenotrophomonas terrae]|uniref:Cytochrome C biogenesis protein n=1 Tax=Stenotrophomonas terrae TaxID=405446 RepID=A0A0R0CS57_9GAMM|nr:tetratricopeptide repeat protein [Stenotrophomonas terrae]KRG72623.1 cytochrome C biogenesis protein [Stenotrophomonas terrae]